MGAASSRFGRRSRSTSLWAIGAEKPSCRRILAYTHKQHGFLGVSNFTKSLGLAAPTSCCLDKCASVNCISFQEALDRANGITLGERQIGERIADGHAPFVCEGSNQAGYAAVCPIFFCQAHTEWHPDACRCVLAMSITKQPFKKRIPHLRHTVAVARRLLLDPAILAGSKIVTSAHIPCRSRPLSKMRIFSALADVIFRIASSSESTFSSRRLQKNARESAPNSADGGGPLLWDHREYSGSV